MGLICYALQLESIFQTSAAVSMLTRICVQSGKVSLKKKNRIQCKLEMEMIRTFYSTALICIT